MNITTYTKMPQCLKCGEFTPGYKYVTAVADVIDGNVIQTMGSNAEALKLTCSRCDFVWLMMCIPEDELS